MGFLRHSNRILLIDDNIDIHEDFRKVLRPLDNHLDHLDHLKKVIFEEVPSLTDTPVYEIDSAFQGKEGFHLVEKSIQEERPYFLAIIDIRMPPGWDGIETIKKIWSIDHDIQTVICTAYSDYSWQEMIKKLGLSDRLLILKKPFDSIEVRQLTCTLSEKWQLLQKTRYQLDLLQCTVDAQKHFEEQLTFQATHDPLTHLPNRLLLVDRLQQAIFQAKRSKTHISVIVFNLDRFKIINDTQGQHFGDDLLKMVGERLQECKRESDTLCRSGGDEFVLIMPGLQKENFALNFIQKIQKTFEEPFIINGHCLTLTGSLGISFFPKNGQDPDTLLKNADAAMHRAKSLGKNTFQFYAEEMNIRMRERLDLEQNLYQAYKLGELFLHYQPIIDVKTQQVRGTEALLRWLHPQLGLIPPQKFISVAEEIGLILPIGEWVLRKACQQNLYWQKLGLPRIPISINLSGFQIRNIDSIKTIESILDEIAYDGHYLTLELTENSLMESNDQVKEVFKRLQNKSISFVIDDFGTGYSNLNYLMHYPISKLKIDKSFIDNLGKDPIEATLIQAIISMAHSLKMKVVAEGVETEHQYKFLSDNQCDEIQGFYFSKAVDAIAYTQLLKEGFFQKI